MPERRRRQPLASHRELVDVESEVAPVATGGARLDAGAREQPEPDGARELSLREQVGHCRDGRLAEQMPEG